MKRIIVFLIFISIFTFSVSAENKPAEIYSQQLEKSGFEDATDKLPSKTKEYLEKWNINPANPNSFENFSAGNVFTEIGEFLRSGGKKPFRTLGQIIAILLLAAISQTFTNEKNSVNSALSFIFSLLIVLNIVMPVMKATETAAAAIKGICTFMLSFIPVFTGIITVSGAAATAASTSTLLLAISEASANLAAFVIVPLMSAYLAIGVSSGVSPLIKTNRLSDAVKNTAMWVLGLIFTVFIGILSVQTTVSAAGDTLGMKTLKFMVGTAVPVAGPALSEAMSTINGSVSLLKSGVGIYGAVAVAITLLPILAELLIWRIVIMLSSVVSGIFSLQKVPDILKAVDCVLAVLIGILLFVGALFIISLAIVMKSRSGI